MGLSDDPRPPTLNTRINSNNKFKTIWQGIQNNINPYYHNKNICFKRYTTNPNKYKQG